MYRAKDLITALFGLVGFRQNENPDYPALASPLLVSSSGLYIQDEHPLLSIENLDQALKNYDGYNYVSYSAATAYSVGAEVRYSDGKAYACIAATIAGESPASTPAKWEEINLFSQKLEQVVRAAINKVVSEVFTKKKLDGVVKSIFESVQLFDGVGDYSDKEIKASRFVGYQIAVESFQDLTLVLRRLGTQFTQVNPDFKLYLYHSSQEAPLKVFSLALSKAVSFEWSRLLDESNEDFVLRYLSNDHAPGGCFYLGYYEDDLIGQAINKGYNFSKAPACAHCNNDYKYYSAWSPFLQVAPIAIPASAIPEPVGEVRPLWDVNYNQYTYTRSYGLNLDLSVRCDVTDFLIREKTLFIDPLLKQISTDLLRSIAFSTRTNQIAKEVRDLALYDLDNRPGTDGYIKKLEKTLAALSFDLSELNAACLPCEQSNGPSWGSV
jgi:hypothetical protein